LGRIAQGCGVSLAELSAWNALDDSARLQAGMMLQVFVKKAAKLEHVRHIREAQARALVAGSAEFHDYFEGLKGKKRLLVVAKQGDTLQGIGRRYGMTAGWMERINQRSRSDKLTRGESVIVYVDRGARSPGVPADGEPETLPAITSPEPAALPVAPDATLSVAGDKN
jgi:LysM repeat protein